MRRITLLPSPSALFAPLRLFAFAFPDLRSPGLQNIAIRPSKQRLALEVTKLCDVANIEKTLETSVISRIRLRSL
ncbi:MAG: hypothetical protein AABZ53_07925 [Planctomycetota bacterium]